MTALRGCRVFRLPYAFLKPNVNIRPSENRFSAFQTAFGISRQTHQISPNGLSSGTRKS